ncbi:uncharacterized protein [Watersipora subatra]|uniref:uncharacterized protein n=1 Tax=Watersipora subatra TaxID=2589382 RepID=UPI00355B8883
MKLTGKLLSTEEQEQPSFFRRYALCVLNIYGYGSDSSSLEKSSKVLRKYSPDATRSVNRSVLVQILIGLLMIACQLPPCYWLFTMVSVKNSMHLNVAMWLNWSDYFAAGIWVGLTVLATGIMGKYAVNKNARCLIAAQLVLNWFAVACSIALIIISSLNLAALTDCKVFGIRNKIQQFHHQNHSNSYYEYIQHYTRDYYYSDMTNTARAVSTTSTTSTPSPISFYGEVFSYQNGENQMFYCAHVVFTAWIVLEATMAVSGLVAFIQAITLLVKGSKVLCLCCRRCCTVHDKEEGADDVSLVQV